MASHALMWERNALPSPWPSEAPFTRPAMSVTFRNAGTLLQLTEKITHSMYHRLHKVNRVRLDGLFLGCVNSLHLRERITQPMKTLRRSLFESNLNWVEATLFPIQVESHTCDRGREGGSVEENWIFLSVHLSLYLSLCQSIVMAALIWHSPPPLHCLRYAERRDGKNRDRFWYSANTLPLTFIFGHVTCARCASARWYLQY